MLLNTRQAGEKLGISANSVITLIRKGVLKDYADTKPGGQRHYFLLNDKEVRDYAAVNGRPYTPRYNTTAKPSTPITPSLPLTNGSYTPAATSPTALARIEARLDSIEQTLNALAKAWA